VSETVSLSHPVATEYGGILYVVGIRDGQYKVRRSADGGDTWIPYSDGSTERTVAAAPMQQRAGLTKLTGQGSPLLACIPEPFQSPSSGLQCQFTEAPYFSAVRSSR